MILEISVAERVALVPEIVPPAVVKAATAALLRVIAWEVPSPFRVKLAVLEGLGSTVAKPVPVTVVAALGLVGAVLVIVVSALVAAAEAFVAAPTLPSRLFAVAPLIATEVMLDLVD